MSLAKLKKALSVEKPSLEVEQQTFRDVVTGELYQILDSSGMSKKALSKKMNLSQAAVSKLLSGDRNFTIDKMTHIAYCLDQKPMISFHSLTKKSHFRTRIVMTEISAESTEELKTDSFTFRRTNKAQVRQVFKVWDMADGF